ncbi:hypothetical protein M422DRAFT_70852, partial [Sphaerobolus stellatus SS14]
MSTTALLNDTSDFFTKIHSRLERCQHTAPPEDFKWVADQFTALVNDYELAVNALKGVRNPFNKVGVHQRTDELRIRADVLYRDALNKLSLVAPSADDAQPRDPHPVYGNVPDLPLRFRPPPLKSEQTTDEENLPEPAAHIPPELSEFTVNGRHAQSEPQIWKRFGSWRLLNAAALNNAAAHNLNLKKRPNDKQEVVELSQVVEAEEEDSYDKYDDDDEEEEEAETSATETVPPMKCMQPSASKATTRSVPAKSA